MNRPIIFQKPISIFMLVSALILSGCATPGQMERLQGRGARQAFPTPFDQTWNAAIDAVYANGLTVLLTNLSAGGGFISAERGIQLYTAGENIGIWIQPMAARKTLVEVVSRQKGPLVWRKNWEPVVLHSVAANLGQLPVMQMAAPVRQAPVITTTSAAPAIVKTEQVQTQSLPSLQERRDELRKLEVLRTAELLNEKDARGRDRLQSELEYLRQELRGIESRLARDQE